jgi:hypothetical protein
VLLVGLLLNALLGWSWADPVAGLVIAAVAVREGVEAWRGDECSNLVTETTEDRISAPWGWWRNGLRRTGQALPPTDPDLAADRRRRRS